MFRAQASRLAVHQIRTKLWTVGCLCSYESELEAWKRARACRIAAPLDEDELAQFAEAEAFLFRFRISAQSDPIVLRVDISEFAEAMNVIRETTG